MCLDMFGARNFQYVCTRNFSIVRVCWFAPSGCIIFCLHSEKLIPRLVGKKPRSVPRRIFSPTTLAVSFVLCSGAALFVGTFGVFACLNLLALLFVVFFVPEGKGRALEEVQRKSRPATSLQPVPREAVSGKKAVVSGTASSSSVIVTSAQEEGVPVRTAEQPVVPCVCSVDSCQESSSNSVIEGKEELRASILHNTGPLQDMAAVSSRRHPSAAVEKRRVSITSI